MSCSLCRYAAVALAAGTAGALVYSTSTAQPQETVNPEKLIEMLKNSAQGEPEPVDPMMEMDPAMIVEMIKAAGKPGPEHNMLKKLAGKWDVEAKFMMDPTAAPEISKGTCVSKMGLNGLCVISEVEMDFNFAGAEIPMLGMGVMGYNRTSGRYESMWMDTTDPYLLIQRGTMRNGKLSVKGEGMSSMGETHMRNDYVFHNDDHWTMEFYQPNPMDPNGDWPMVGSIDYTRK